MFLLLLFFFIARPFPFPIVIPKANEIFYNWEFFNNIFTKFSSFSSSIDTRSLSDEFRYNDLLVSQLRPPIEGSRNGYFELLKKAWMNQ